MRKPLRLTLTGTAWSASVISTASNVNGPTRTRTYHDALRVDERLADEDVVDEPAIQVEPLPIRSRSTRRSTKRGGLRRTVDIEQLAQARVLALDLEPLQPRFRLEALAAKLRFSEIDVCRAANVSLTLAHVLNGR